VGQFSIGTLSFYSFFSVGYIAVVFVVLFNDLHITFNIITIGIDFR
jgi:hypothetical protein